MLSFYDLRRNQKNNKILEKQIIQQENKFIISAGLGEDASFDIEVINKYNCISL